MAYLDRSAVMLERSAENGPGQGRRDNPGQEHLHSQSVLVGRDFLPGCEGDELPKEGHSCKPAQNGRFK